jgi:hypothetical protein
MALPLMLNVFILPDTENRVTESPELYFPVSCSGCLPVPSKVPAGIIGPFLFSLLLQGERVLLHRKILTGG